MILSFWRKSHLLLAIFSSLFLIIASITGSVLSFEPINNSLKESYVGNENQRNLAQLVGQLEKIYPETFEIVVDDKEGLSISVLDDEGEFQTIHINPATGEKTNVPTEESALFSFCRILHRSLFLGSSGRFIMGFASFLLFFISISGIALVIKRQLGILGFFSKVTNSTKIQFNHIVLGRLAVFSLLIIAFTGSFLSMKRFEVFPEIPEQESNFSELEFKQYPQQTYTTFKTFQQIKLEELKSLQYPFSDEPEDYFEVELIDKKLLINQFNGSIISTTPISSFNQFYQLNFNLHTGKGSVLWSIVLLIASISILYFIYSGFKMTLARQKGRKKNKYSKEEATTVILVGSEGGQSWGYASYVYEQLRQNKVKVFLDDLNNYTHYPKLKNLLVITSTYGNGTAPSNADQFLEKYDTIAQTNTYRYSVLAFGSRDYTNYCQFGHDVFLAMQHGKNNEASLPITLINKQSEQQFKSWVNDWFSVTNISIHTPFSPKQQEAKNDIKKFKIISISKPEAKNNQTFILELSSKNTPVQPGDLFLYSPEKREKERYYSCGVNEKGNILLVIKKHEFGKASSHLSHLEKGKNIYARILANPDFNLLQSTNDVIAICNGTGIAPFIGMPKQYNTNQQFSIYWGLKSSELYEEILPYFQNKNSAKTTIHTCYSALQNISKTYVQDKIKEDGAQIAQVLQAGGTVFICGSIEMRNAVLQILDRITLSHNNRSLENYVVNQQIKIDCY